MMDKHLHIIPYTKEHGQFILSCQMNHKVLEADKTYINLEGNAKNLEQDHLAFTGMVRSKPIFAAGMKMVWGRVAEGWVIATSDMWNHPLSVAKAIKNTVIQVIVDNIFCAFKDIAKGFVNLVTDFLFELVGKIVNVPFYCPATTLS